MAICAPHAPGNPETQGLYPRGTELQANNPLPSLHSKKAGAGAEQAAWLSRIGNATSEIELVAGC
jgi:hypothetical protein